MLKLSQAVLNALDEDVLIFNSLLHFVFPNSVASITDAPHEVVAKGRTYTPNSDLLSADIGNLGGSEVSISFVDYDSTWRDHFTLDNYPSTKLELDLYIADTAFPLYRGLCSAVETGDYQRSVRLNARFETIILEQSKVSFLTDNDQRKRGGPGDSSLEFINETLDIAWGRLVQRAPAPANAPKATR